MLSACTCACACVLQMLNAYRRDEAAEVELLPPFADAAGNAEQRLHWWGRVRRWLVLPHKLRPWVSILAMQVAMPSAGLLAHACGAGAGVMYACLEPEIMAGCKAWMLKCLQVQLPPTTQQQEEREQEPRRMHRRRWRSVPMELIAMVGVIAMGGVLENAHKARQRRVQSRQAGPCRQTSAPGSSRGSNRRLPWQRAAASSQTH